MRPFCRTSSTALDDLAAHQRAGEHEQPNARQSHHRSNGAGELVFADQRNRVDRDPLAADVVPVGLGDGAERDLTDLRAAAHDDDPLAVDLGEGRRQRHVRHAGYLAELDDDRFDVRVDGEFQVKLRLSIAMLDDVDVADIGLAVGEHFRHA